MNKHKVEFVLQDEEDSRYEGWMLDSWILNHAPLAIQAGDLIEIPILDKASLSKVISKDIFRVVEVLHRYSGSGPVDPGVQSLEITVRPRE